MTNNFMEEEYIASGEHALVRGGSALIGRSLTSSGGSADDYFPLFVALACAAGVILAIFISCVLHRKSKEASADITIATHLFVTPTCSMSTVLLLSAGCSIIALGGVNIPSNSGKDRANAVAAVCFGSVLVISCGLLIGYVLFKLSSVYPAIACAGTCLLLIPGLTILSVYCKRMQTVERYDYHGPMYILGYDVVPFRSERCYHGSVCNGYKGRLGIVFGKEWACPEQTDKLCTSIANDKDCRENTCEYLQDSGCTNKKNPQEARYNVGVCMKEKYGIPYSKWSEIGLPVADPDFDADDREFDEFDPNLPPNTQEDQVWNLHGDCNSCSVAFNVPIENAQSIKPVGTWLSIAGGAILLIDICAALGNGRYSICKISGPWALFTNWERNSS